MAGHAGELVIVQVGSGWARRVTGHATQQGVWVQHQAPLTLGTLVGLGPGAARTCLVALLAFHGCRLVVCARGAVFGAPAVVQFGSGIGARLAVVGQGPETSAAGGVAGATAVLLHVIIVPRGATGLTGSVQDQVEEAASETSPLIQAHVAVGRAASTGAVLCGVRSQGAVESARATLQEASLATRETLGLCAITGQTGVVAGLARPLRCLEEAFWAVGPAPSLVEEYVAACGAAGAHIPGPQAGLTVRGTGLTQLGGSVGVRTKRAVFYT